MVYTYYSSLQDVNDLDRNKWKVTEKDIVDGAAGRHIYSAPPRQPAYYLCFGGRDPETHYVYGVERDTHPDHFSRFGYANHKNGYGSGAWPGKYRVNEACEKEPQPQDMAPERFYSEERLSPYFVKSQATVDYDWWKNHRTNVPAWNVYPPQVYEQIAQASMIGSCATR